MKAPAWAATLAVLCAAGGLVWWSPKPKDDENSLIDRYLAAEQEDDRRALDPGATSAPAFPWRAPRSSASLREEVLRDVSLDRLLSLVRKYDAEEDRDAVADLAWAKASPEGKAQTFEALLPWIGDDMHGILAKEWLRSLDGASDPAIERWIAEQATARNLLSISRGRKPAWTTLLGKESFALAVSQARRRLAKAGDEKERKKSAEILSIVPPYPLAKTPRTRRR